MRRVRAGAVVVLLAAGIVTLAGAPAQAGCTTQFVSNASYSPYDPVPSVEDPTTGHIGVDISGTLDHVEDTTGDVVIFANCVV